MVWSPGSEDCMRTGKISESVLKRSVLKQCKVKNPAVIQGAGIGRDCAVFLAGEKRVVSCSVHPSVLDSTLKIRYSLEHAINNLACSGCMPVSVMLSLLLPLDFEEERLKSIMEEADFVCREFGIQISGGHTEATGAVNQPVLSVTALGVLKKNLIKAADICPGLDVLVLGAIGREGTTLLVNREEEALKRRFPLGFVEEARQLGASISVVREAIAVGELGACALHDVSQGGIFGALWEMCEGANVGLEADLRRIPIRQETIEVCEYLGKNPYCLLSGGALLAVVSDGKYMVQELHKQGIEAVVIGRTTSGNGRILHNGEEIRYLERPTQDQIFGKE